MNADDTAEYIPLPEGCEAIPDPRFGAFCYEKKSLVIGRRKGFRTPMYIWMKPETATPNETSQAMLLIRFFGNLGMHTYFDPAKLVRSERQKELDVCQVRTLCLVGPGGYLVSVSPEGLEADRQAQSVWRDFRNGEPPTYVCDCFGIAGSCSWRLLPFETTFVRDGMPVSSTMALEIDGEFTIYTR